MEEEGSSCCVLFAGFIWKIGLPEGEDNSFGTLI
jgi:hypothetical protein